VGKKRLDADEVSMGVVEVFTDWLEIHDYSETEHCRLKKG